VAILTSKLAYSRKLVYAGLPSAIIGALTVYSARAFISSGGVSLYSSFTLFSTALGFAATLDFGVIRNALLYASNGKSSERYNAILSLIAPIRRRTIAIWLITAPLLILSLAGSNQYMTYVCLGIFVVPFQILFLTLVACLQGRGYLATSCIAQIVQGLSVSLVPVLCLSFHTIFKDKVYFFTLLASLYTAAGLVSTYFIYKLGQPRHSNVIKAVKIAVFANYSNLRCRDDSKFRSLMALAALLGLCLSTADRFLIASILGLENIQFASYSASSALALKLLVVPAAVAIISLPQVRNLKDVYSFIRRQIKILAVVFIPVLILVGAYASPIISYMSDGKADIHSSVLTFRILLLGVFFNGAAQTPYNILSISNRHNWKLLAVGLIELILFAPILFYMTRTFQIVGASITWTLRAIFDFALISLLACQCGESNAR